MEEKFSVFQSFIVKDDAINLAQRLEAEGIPYLIENNNAPVDVTFAFDHSWDEYRIKIPLHLFDDAHKILEEKAREEAGEVPEDHFLNAFETEELYDVLKTPDEWSKTDYIYAQELLIKREKIVDQEQLTQWKAERIAFLRQPEVANLTAKILGYMAALSSFFMGPITGAVGAFLGRHFMNNTKSLPSGETVPTYDEKSRKSGKNIFYLSLAGIGFWVLAVLGYLFKYGPF